MKAHAEVGLADLAQAPALLQGGDNAAVGCRMISTAPCGLTATVVPYRKKA